MKPEPSLPPIVRAISVSWNPEEAFRRFTHGFADWWPRATHSIGGQCVERIVFECKVGGLIYEQHRDGRRFQWGVVREWEPPRRVRFSWHPSRNPRTAQDVALSFHPEGSGMRLELVASDWERWGKGAPRARRGYGLGWWAVLHVWAGRRTLGTRSLDAVAAVARGVQALRGGSASSIASAAGEIERASPTA